MRIRSAEEARAIIGGEKKLERYLNKLLLEQTRKLWDETWKELISDRELKLRRARKKRPKLRKPKKHGTVESYEKFARHLRKNIGWLELQVMDALYEHGFESNVPVQAQTRPFIVDCLHREKKIGVEVQENKHHSLPKKRRADASRLEELKASGYTMFEIWEDDIRADLSSALRPVLEALRSS